MKSAFIALLGLFVWTSMSAPLSALNENLGFYGFGGRLSYVNSEDGDEEVGIGAHVDLGTLFDLLWIYPCVEYWGKSLNEESLNREQTFTQVSINGDVRFVPPATLGRVLPYLGGGVCAILSSISSTVYDPYYGYISASHSDVRLGVEVLAGAHVPFSAVAVFLEGKYRWSDVDLWKITGGFTISMGR